MLSLYGSLMSLSREGLSSHILNTLRRNLKTFVAFHVLLIFCFQTEICISKGYRCVCLLLLEHSKSHESKANLQGLCYFLSSSAIQNVWVLLCSEPSFAHR